MPLAWHRHEPVTLDVKGKPTFPPTTPCGPGLYRLVLPDGRVKIGQGESVSRRLAEYRNPTRGNPEEHFIKSALITSGGATLETFTDGDLSDKAARLALERAEQAAADEAEWPRLRPDSAWRVKFHEGELARARARLAAEKPN